MKVYLYIEDGRDDLKDIQNGSYFRYGLIRGMNAKKYSKKQSTVK